MRLHDKIRETYMYIYVCVCICIYMWCARARYSLLEMRPAFASTSDPSGSRRATNRVTARDPRPKSPGSLPFLPSFLRSSDALRDFFFLLYLSFSLHRLLHSRSVFFFTLLLTPPQLLVSFLYSVGQYNRSLAIEGTWFSGRFSRSGREGERAECENRRKRESRSTVPR